MGRNRATTVHRKPQGSGYACDVPCAKCGQIVKAYAPCVQRETEVSWFRGDDECERFHVQCWNEVSGEHLQEFDPSQPTQLKPKAPDLTVPREFAMVAARSVRDQVKQMLSEYIDDHNHLDSHDEAVHAVGDLLNSVTAIDIDATLSAILDTDRKRQKRGR